VVVDPRHGADAAVEAALARSEARFRVLIDRDPDGIVLVGGDGAVRYANPAAGRLLGRAPTGLVGQPFGFPLVAGDTTEIDVPLMESGPGVAEMRVVEMEWQGETVRFAALRDITERHRAQLAVRESERLFRALFEYSLDQIAVIAPDGTIRFASPSHVQTIGFTGDELRGLDAFSRIHPDDQPTVRREFEVLLADPRQTRTMQYRFRHRDGTYREVEAIGCNLCDAGVVGGILVNSRDVTVRRRAEAELRQFNQELERRVRDRTAELRAANDELDAFGRSVSHDLRGPLRIIEGFSAAISELDGDRLSPRGREHLDRVRRAARRMSELIDALFRLSRVTSHSIRRQPVDLAVLARAIAAELRAREPGRQVTFVIAPALPVQADPALIRVLLENLLDNAWKYTRRRAMARVDVGVERLDGEDVYFVRDDGCGFDPTCADRLFQPFRRLHTEAEFEGTGIGLATVCRIVQRHSGRVWATGAPDHGATIRFTIPPPAREA